MPIRLSGLASGLDTEAIVGALVSAYSYKKDKYVKAQTKLSWKQDAWKTLNSKVYSLYTSVGQMRYSSNYSTKKCLVSDTSKANATASGIAINGTQTLKINELATTAYITGGEVSSSITGSSTLSSLGVKNEGTDDNIRKASIQVRTSKGSTTIELDSSMTVNQFVNKLNDAGVQANFDEKNHRFFVSGNKSGKDGDFTLTGNNDLGINALINLGLMSKSEVEAISSDSSSATNIKMVARKLFTYTSNGADKDYYGSAESVQSLLTNIKKAKYIVKDFEDNPDTHISTQAEKDWADEYLANNADLVTYFENELKGDADEMDWSALTADEIKTKATALFAAGSTAYGTEEQAATKKEISKAINTIRDAYINIASIKSDDTIESEQEREIKLQQAKTQLKSLLNDPVNKKWAEYVQNNFGTVNTGTSDDYTDFWSQSDNLELTNSVFNRIDLSAQISINHKEFNVPSGLEATSIKGEDAEIELNGVKYYSDTNNITVNGLTIEALAKTSQAITVTVQNDTDALYDKVKDFLTSYNSLMNEMQKLYNADSAKDYEPLTEDEKKEMSESEIEKWEQKIKDSLLRRDTQLSGVISAMTMSMMKTYEVNGKTYAWSTLGIHTLGTLNAEKNEGYAYHIDGDSEDTYTSGKTDKLKAALAEDPDSVIDFLKQMTSGLYSSLDAKMKSTAVKSVYTVYNDKEMASEYSDYSNLIKTWTNRVQDMEDAYYKKFSAMEKALAQLQANSSSISSLLGG